MPKIRLSSQDGATIYEARLAMGWERLTLAEEYGRALGESIQEGTMKAMEEQNRLPEKQVRRRAILAALLHLPPAALGLTVAGSVAPVIKLGSIVVGQKLDLPAYHTRLNYLWENGAVESAGLLENVIMSVASLQHGRGDQQEITRLLCGYQSLAGQALSELGYFDTALMYHEKAITLATERGQEDLVGFGFWRRACTLSYWGQYDAAVQDLMQAKVLEQKLPGPLRGYTSSLLGEELSHLAHDTDAFNKAIDSSDEAERYIGEDAELNGYIMRFNRVRHVLNLSAVLVASPNTKLHESDEAVGLIEEEVSTFDDSRSAQYRQSFCNIVLARAYIDQREYAHATKLLADSVAIMKEMQSTLHLVEVEQLYKQLRQTSYKDSVEVARLNLGLMQLKHPGLFA